MKENYNLDFSKNLAINTSEMDWVKSPSPNVLRKPLEREAKESGHTTSVVQYLPNSKFSEHSHPLGEEIFVLEGVFSDEHGDYPAGTYIRNPPGSSHSPFSREGCIIFVKLNQFSPEDKKRIVVDTKTTQWHPGHGNLEVMPLHRFGTESVALVKWPEGERFISHTHFGGEEIFVLSGEFRDEHGVYPKGTWLRSRHLSNHHPWVEKETIIFVKTGHLI
ncbi:cupin [Halobacteriovorax vibrionivorans]|uniref:Cupin n=1 Tax=Halobacteriovorax vibrionivorans TaxID=2152716 RepID=A0ABY0IGP6_9BACT|nr:MULTISPECIES: cupin domain-containing protein [Halobacteriovorax]RZF21694.1 cupin [Halobacteriovorax vibrionivorans]TGD49013.1 cupin [Halobacteriovorax sp. Y22]